MLNNVTFYTLHEIAAKFGVSYQMVYNLVRRGELPAYRFGKSYRVAEKDLEDYLRKQRVQVSGYAPRNLDGVGVAVGSRGIAPSLPALTPQLIAGEAVGTLGTAEPLPEALDMLTLLIGGFAVYLCAKERVKFGRHPAKNDFAIVDWKHNAKPTEKPTSTVSREQLEICNGGDSVLLFTNKASTRIDGLSPAASKGGIPLPSQCRLSMGDIAFQVKIHTDEAHKVLSATLAREDALPEGFALVWQSCELGALNASLAGFRIYHQNGGFLLQMPSGKLLGLAEGMKYQEGGLDVEARHFMQRLIGQQLLE